MDVRFTTSLCNSHDMYLDEHVWEDTEDHVDVRLWVGELLRSLYIKGAAGGKGEGEGAEDDARQLGLRWSTC